MPRDLSIKKVLLIGSGPIVIGQAAEFDYAGTQAAKVWSTTLFRPAPAVRVRALLLQRRWKTASVNPEASPFTSKAAA